MLRQLQRLDVGRTAVVSTGECQQLAYLGLRRAAHVFEQRLDKQLPSYFDCIGKASLGDIFTFDLNLLRLGEEVLPKNVQAALDHCEVALDDFDDILQFVLVCTHRSIFRESRKYLDGFLDREGNLCELV